MAKTFDVAAIAEMYGVSGSTVGSWIASDEMRAVCVSRSARSKKPRWRISEEALRAFERKRASVPPPQQSQRRRKSGDDQIIEFYE